MADPIGKLTRSEWLVIRERRKYKSHWRTKPDRYWYWRLLQEVVELGLALLGVHKDMPEWELKQISGICINWHEMRTQLKGEQDDQTETL